METVVVAKVFPNNNPRFAAFAPEIDPAKEDQFKVKITFWAVFAIITPAAAVEIKVNELWFTLILSPLKVKNIADMLDDEVD